MCHLILLMPVLALPLFWLVPLTIAAPVYVLILAASVGVYFLAIRAMQRPVQTGAEALRHATGIVTGKGAGVFQVRVHSEIWNAESAEDLSPGDGVEVVSVKNMRLKVRRLGETASVRLVPR